jgi:calmodulin
MSNFKLSPKELQEYQEAFAFFDKDHDGFVTIKEVGQIMRSVGLYPSEAELDEIKKTARGKIDFNEFLNIAVKNMTDNKVNATQMIEAFKIFDQYGTGLVNLLQMKSALQNLGEKLRDEELDELLREADIDADGNVNYEELVHILCGK